MAESCPVEAGHMVYIARSALLSIDTLPKWTVNECELDEEPPSARLIGEEESEVEPTVEEKAFFALYPNPNQGTFMVQLSLTVTEEATMEVWSVSGQLLYSKRLYPGSNRLQLNVADGLYLYRVMVNREPKWLGKISIGSE